MKKSFAVLMTVIITLSSMFAFTVSAESVMKSGNFNLYTWNEGQPMSINGKGQFVSDGFAWKLAEFKQAPVGDFTIETDILTQDGMFNDSVNFYQHAAAYFAVAGYDKSTSYGVFFNTRVSGILEVYLCKWSGGAWRGYQPLDTGGDSYIFDSVLADAGDNIVLKTKISVSGNTVKVNATVESTGKKIDECVFDLSKQFNGENKINEVERNGTVAFTTQRMTDGPQFANIKITDSTGVLKGVAEDSSSKEATTSNENSSSQNEIASKDEASSADNVSSVENDSDHDNSLEEIDTDKNDDNNSTILWIVIIVLSGVIVAGAAAAAVFIIKNKRPKAK